MKSRIIFIILLISLAFNVGFIVKYVHKVCKKPETIMPAPPKHDMKNQRFTPNENVIAARNDNIQLRKDFFTELAQPEVNNEIVNELLHKLDESQRLLEQAVLEHFIELRSNMEADEAETFFTRFLNRYETKNEGFSRKEIHRRKK